MAKFDISLLKCNARTLETFEKRLVQIHNVLPYVYVSATQYYDFFYNDKWAFYAIWENGNGFHNANYNAPMNDFELHYGNALNIVDLIKRIDNIDTLSDDDVQALIKELSYLIVDTEITKDDIYAIRDFIYDNQPEKINDCPCEFTYDVAIIDTKRDADDEPYYRYIKDEFSNISYKELLDLQEKNHVFINKITPKE